VESARADVSLSDLIAEVEGLELSGPLEAHPAHPLDTEPLIEAATRLVGATAGLAFLAARKAAGSTSPPTVRRGPAEIAALLGVVEGFPPLREPVRRVLGPTG